MICGDRRRALWGGGSIQRAGAGRGGTSGLLCVWNLYICPGGCEERLQPVHHLSEEDQRLHRLCHSICCGYHPLSQDSNVFTAAFHWAGCLLYRRPQLVQSLLIGRLHGCLLRHPARLHGARGSCADARALGTKLLRQVWMKVGAFVEVAWYAKTGRIWSTGERSRLFSRVIPRENRQNINPYGNE